MSDERYVYRILCHNERTKAPSPSRATVLLVRLKGFEPPTFWFVAVLEVQFVPIFSHFQPFRLKIEWSCDLFCPLSERIPAVSVVVVVVIKRASLDQRGSNSNCVLIVTLTIRLVNSFLLWGNAGRAMQ